MAGFAGVVVVLRRGDDRFHPADEFRVFIALVPSLVAGFLALLPVGLDQAGLAPRAVWAVAAAGYAAIVTPMAVAINRRLRRLPSEARAIISVQVGVVSSGLVVLAVAAVVANATTSLLGPPRGGFLFFGILLLLGISANAFVRMVFIRPPD